MLHLLLGKDYFAKKSYISELAKQNQAAQVWYSLQTMPVPSSFLEQSLFKISQIIVLENCLADQTLFDALPMFHNSSDQFVVVEEKVDKRKTAIINLLKLPNLAIKEFVVPREPQELAKWVSAHAKNESIEITPDAVSELVIRLGFGRAVGFETPEPDVWQIHNELKKLAAFAGTEKITKENVELLVVDQNTPQVWDIIDALGKRQSAQVLTLLQNFLAADTTSDEKAKIIQFNALLADQFRSLLLVRSAMQQGIPDAEILSATGWKSGKLFMVKKNAAAFDEKVLVNTLTKLEALDIELKTSSIPPKVLIDLISSQI